MSCPRSHPVLCRKNSKRTAAGTPCVRVNDHCKFTDDVLKDLDVQFPYSFPSFETKSKFKTASNTKPLRKIAPKFVSLFESFDLQRVLDSNQKQGASSSVIAFARHRATGRLVVLKCFLEFDRTPLIAAARSDSSTDDEDIDEEALSALDDNIFQFDKLMFEGTMYEIMADSIGDKIPNLVTWVTNFHIPMTGEDMRKVVNTPPAPLADVLFEQLLGLDEYNDPVGLHVIVTEYRPDTQLMFVTLDEQSSTEAVRSFMFQIVFTLAVMHINGFQHNDLHTNNILIDNKPDEQSIVYNFGGISFKVPMKYGKVLLFDWDLGSCRDCGPNTALPNSMCPEYGVCDTLNDRFDLFITLNSMNDVNDAEFKSFLRRVRGTNEIHEAFPGRICMLNYFGKCRELRPNEPSSVMTAAKALRDAYFAPFVV